MASWLLKKYYILMRNEMPMRNEIPLHKPNIPLTKGLSTFREQSRNEIHKT